MPKLYFSATEDDSRAISAKVKKGVLKRVYRGIYTDAPYPEIERLILSKWYEITHYLFPNSIVAYRTAHELRPINGQVYVVKENISRRNIVIYGCLTINILNGNTTDLIAPFLRNISRSSPSRQYIENLSISRSSTKKSLGREWVEKQLSSELQKDEGEKNLNTIRDQARVFSANYCFAQEFIILNDIISSILSTHSEGSNLVTEIAKATSQKIPFDTNRISTFESFASYLLKCNLASVQYTYNKHSWANLAFFESYFSNFIEGTEFEIEEAEEIVFNRNVVNNRHQDGHDVTSIYNQVHDFQAMSETPQSSQEFITTLKDLHFEIMQQRPEKRPGKFKERINKAGSSIFVKPRELQGTLIKAFEIYKTLPTGLESAILMQFIISECHPFDDGNGRLSRIMMNRELHSADLHKIIVPTVHRDSYLNGLRQATRDGKFSTLTKVFYQLQHYSASINWSVYGDARETIESHQANLLPDDGVTTFNKIIRQFKFNPIFK